MGNDKSLSPVDKIGYTKSANAKNKKNVSDVTHHTR
jgi:hypothetical protein